MIVTAAELAPFVVGTHQTEVIDGALCCRRLPEQWADFYSAAESQRIRRDCSSNVCLRLITDATALGIRMQLRAAARPLSQGVVLADGQTFVFGPDDARDAWSGTVGLPATTEPRLVQLWLPHLVDARLHDLDLIDATMVSADGRQRRRWLVCGDSITQGMTAGLPTETWVGRSSIAFDLETWNLGVGGAKIEPFMSATPLTWPYEVMTIAFGTNDFNQSRPLAQYRDDLRGFVTSQLQARPASPVLVISPPPWVDRVAPNNRGRTLDDFRQAAAEACAGIAGATCVPGAQLMPGESAFFADGVHPNSLGMGRYAEALAPYLSAALSA